MILVAGISKSGKTTVCQEVVKYSPSLRHLKASAVLRSLGRPIESLSENDIFENQTALIRFLSVERTKAEIDLLDGHAIVETGRLATMLPRDVFEGLKLSGIAVVIEEPHIISARRLGTAFETSVEWIASVQQMELECCTIEASRLSLPIVALAHDRVRNLCRFYAELNERPAASH